MGASHISVALCDLRGSTLRSASQNHDVPGPAGHLAFDGEMVDAYRHAPKRAVPARIGLASQPGRCVHAGLPFAAPLAGLERRPLAQNLYQRFGARVFMDNDANCGALAESLLGAGAACLI